MLRSAQKLFNVQETNGYLYITPSIVFRTPEQRSTVDIAICILSDYVTMTIFDIHSHSHMILAICIFVNIHSRVMLEYAYFRNMHSHGLLEYAYLYNMHSHDIQKYAYSVHIPCIF